MFCYSIETDFADIGITSADFGFDVFDWFKYNRKSRF
jgi:hypothetical protein